MIWHDTYPPAYIDIDFPISLLPVVVAVATMILIGVQTNVVASVCNQVAENVACRVMAKVSVKQKNRVLKLTSILLLYT